MSSSTLTSVTNAVRALKAFSSSNPEWGVTDLARHLDLGKSTVHRILSTLTDEGMLEQSTETGKYRLGLVVFDLAAFFLLADQITAINPAYGKASTGLADVHRGYPRYHFEAHPERGFDIARGVQTVSNLIINIVNPYSGLSFRPVTCAEIPVRGRLRSSD